MRNLLLTYNNTTFTVTVDEETYNDVTKDMNALHSYARLVYEESFGKTDDMIIQDQNGEDTLSDLESQSSSCMPKQNFKKRKYVNQETSALQSDQESFRWNDRMIRCLLQVRLGKDAEFNNPVCKKIKLWKQVAIEITEITGVTVTGEACDTKFRNLLATYRLNKKKQSKTGEGAIKWEYFSIFDEVLGCKASSLAPSENIGDSLDNSQVQNSADTFSDLESPSSSLGSSQTAKEKCRKRKSGMSLQAYLWEKNKREERREKDIEKNNEEKAKRQKLIWEEKKALKEKEIDAVLALAKAIAESKK